MDITETLNRNFFCILLRTLLHPVKNSHKRQFHWLSVSPPVSPPPEESIFFPMIVRCLFPVIHKCSLQILYFFCLFTLYCCHFCLYVIENFTWLFQNMDFLNKFNVNLECNSYMFSFFPPTRGLMALSHQTSDPISSGTKLAVWPSGSYINSLSF